MPGASAWEIAILRSCRPSAIGRDVLRSGSALRGLASRSTIAGVNPSMPGGTAGGKESDVAKIPKALHEHINTAFPAHVCLVGTVLPSGFAQVSPRGSMMVYGLR